MNLNPVCVSCKIEMSCFKNGLGIQTGEIVFSADVFKCRKCGMTVAAGFSPQSIPAYEWGGTCLKLEE
jgi:hypothetical protein